MLRRQVRMDRTARTKNGQPAQRTTGVARSNSIHGWISGESGPPCPPVAMPVITRISSGSDSAAATQKRRVMSRNSGLSATSAVGISGSSAMPQIGQSPGLSARTSGSMGQIQTWALECVGTGALEVWPPAGFFSVSVIGWGPAAWCMPFGPLLSQPSGSAANLVRHPGEQK